jgi:hypothetical protein
MTDEQPKAPGWPDAVKTFAQNILEICKWIVERGTTGWLAFIAAASFVVWGSLDKVFPGHARIRFISLATGVIAIIALLIYLLFLNRKRKQPPKPVKGLAPFGIEDEELFTELGRNQEVADVRHRSTQDTHEHIIVVAGKPGIGKTSFLQAGVQPKLEKRQAYYQATAQSAPTAFAQLLREQLKMDDLPDDLSWLPPNAEGTIIIDQFEQLTSALPNHQAFFTFLQLLAQQPSTYKLKCILGITYHDDLILSDPALRDIRPSLYPFILEPLSAAQAQRNMMALLERANMRVDKKVVQWYLAQVATPERTVSPKDIGLGIAGLAQWYQTSTTPTFARSKFLQRGGASGILAAHTARVLSSMPRAHQVALLQATLKCFSDDSGPLTPQALAQANSDIKEDEAREYLARLANTNSRILERLGPPEPAEQYRLATDRLVPILRYYAHKPKLESESLLWRFGDYYHRWYTHQRSKPYLIFNPRIWWRVCQQQALIRNIYQGNDPPVYIAKSTCTQQIIWASALLCVAALGFGGYRWYGVHTRNAQPIRLAAWNFPDGFYTRLEHLETLSISGASMTDLQWLQAPNLHELTITNSAKLASLEGITNAPHLQTLSLDLANTVVPSLAPVAALQELKTLTLNLGKSQITHLDELNGMSKLTTLTVKLTNKQVPDLTSLQNIPSLEDLRIRHADIQINDRTEVDISDELRVPALTQLKRLTVEFPERKLTRLPDWPALPNLEELTVELQKTKVQHLPSFTPVAGLHRLTLHVAQSELDDLPDLSILTRLQEFHANLSGTGIQGISVGENALLSLHTLELTAGGSGIQTLPPWERFPNLTHLALDLQTPLITAVQDLSVLSNLTELRFNLNYTGVRQLPGLGHLERLTTLALTMNQAAIQNLAEIEQLEKLTTLELAINWSQVRALPDLAQHQKLRTLSLALSSTDDILPGQLGPIFTILTQHVPATLTTLTLDLTGSTLQTLPSLAAFYDLHVLTIKLPYASTNDLASLTPVPHLQALTLYFKNSAITTLPALHSTELTDLTLFMQFSQVTALPVLTEPTQLHTLIIDAEKSALDHLPDMSHWDNLTTATMHLPHTHLVTLAPLHTMHALQTHIAIDGTIHSLDNFPASLHQLDLIW